MNDFIFHIPTKVVFGRNAEAQCGALVRAFGGTRVLIHYGGGSAVKSGLLARVASSLDAAGVTHVALGGVAPNPRLSLVRAGAGLCRREGVDFILAVGGGSVIDSAKAIGYALANPGDVWDFYCKKRVPAACMPIGAVLTIAAAGSEMSNSSVITNEDGMLKRGCNSELSRPKFAVMNPERTMTLSPYQTASGCVDILMHTLERYLGRPDGAELTDGFSEELLRVVMHCARVLRDTPDDYDARAEIMWAGSLSHNGLTGCGGTGGDWASHQLEHELSGMFDVAHGAGLAAVWGSWARYVLADAPERFARLGLRVLGVVPRETTVGTALAAVETMEEFFRDICMPTSIRDMGIVLTDDVARELAEKCSFFGTRTVGSVRKLDRTDLYNIYLLAGA